VSRLASWTESDRFGFNVCVSQAAALRYYLSHRSIMRNYLSGDNFYFDKDIEFD
jgi:hypothetical protein